MLQMHMHKQQIHNRKQRGKILKLENVTITVLNLYMAIIRLNTIKPPQNYNTLNTVYNQISYLTI